MKKYTIGIVGGSGFIGSSLAMYLSKYFNIKIIDVKPPSLMLEDISYTYCDIRNYNALSDALEDVNLVIHTAIIQIPEINEKKRLAYEVNFIGTQNVCKAVDELPSIKGMILAGTWHVIGEKEISGVIDETFGYRPDKVENRARLYALSKIAQETIVRFYDSMSDKIYSILRLGTVLGEKMPEKTAANIFITKGLKGEPITPYRHSMYRPMLYVDINDVCQAYYILASKIISEEISKDDTPHIINIYYPEPITILDLARIVKNTIVKLTNGDINPEIKIIDKGISPLFTPDDKHRIKVYITKAKKFLGIKKLISPSESIERIVTNRLNKLKK